MYCCILSKFYIKPQQKLRNYPQSVVVSYRNSTSNHNFKDGQFDPLPVVSYRNSTSNHNAGRDPGLQSHVVSYRNSTSNHNHEHCHRGSGALYLIEILHQTTTTHLLGLVVGMLYLIEILHQTTTHTQQHWYRIQLYLIEILHQTTTRPQLLWLLSVLYLIEILHQTTTHRYCACRLYVVSYRNSTSNHNYPD